MRRRNNDGGFTLVELLLTMVIIGIIMVPLGNFILAYLKGTENTQNRISYSGELQILTAYFSQDVANAGLYTTTDGYTYQGSQAIWTSGFPNGSCGQAQATATSGYVTLLLQWDGSPAGAKLGSVTNSAAYVLEGSALHRVACSRTGTGPDTVTSDATIGQDFLTVTAQCPDNQDECNVHNPPPQNVYLHVDVESSGTDAAALSVTLRAQRRVS